MQKVSIIIYILNIKMLIKSLTVFETQVNKCVLTCEMYSNKMTLCIPAI